MPRKKLAKPQHPSTLRLVVFGQGTTENRGATLMRLSDRLREELGEVAQGQLYLIVEIALRRLIDELKARPAGIEAISAEDIIAEPPLIKSAKRAPRPRKDTVAID